MNFENDIFKKYVPDYKKLLNYGFTKNGEIYEYHILIMDDLEVFVYVSSDQVCGKIIDLSFGEEYTNFRLEEQVGGFAGSVREKYISILEDIKNNCFISKPFVSAQANRIASLINKFYKIQPIYKWDKYDFAVFENNNKWFGLIMNIDRNKFSDLSGEVEILNVKVDKNNISKLLEMNGFYRAYHMNKKSWVTVALDENVSDKKIMELIDESYSYTVSFKGSSNEWVMPINPSYFDIFAYFDGTDEYYWDKKKSFKKDDIVYLYVTKPIGAIMYKCFIKDFTHDFMIVKKICKYEEGKYNLDLLKKYGLTSVRSARHIPLKLSEFLKENE